MLELFKEIGKYFRLKGEAISFEQLTDGNINKTYKVYYDNDKSYIFQSVNISVFVDPIGVMKNIDYVTTFIREEYSYENALHYHHTVYGDNYLFYKGGFWRVMKSMNATSFNTCESLEDIEKVGKAFGDFQQKISPLDCTQLVETIKDFHNTKVRLDKLFEDAKGVSMPELDYLNKVKDKASEISIMTAKGELPLRACHNDTKSNNVLFDNDTHEPIVVIDLDTLMPGVGMNDFADGVRFICNTAKEDEKDLSLVEMSTSKFEAYCKGFLPKVKNVWSEKELGLLVQATFSITIELAARFLDDYILGNKYFKINYPEHNLDRARCQIKLAQSIEEKWDELERIVQNEIKSI